MHLKWVQYNKKKSSICLDNCVLEYSFNFQLNDSKIRNKYSFYVSICSDIYPNNHILIWGYEIIWHHIPCFMFNKSSTFSFLYVQVKTKFAYFYCMLKTLEKTETFYDFLFLKNTNESFCVSRILFFTLR